MRRGYLLASQNGKKQGRTCRPAGQAELSCLALGGLDLNSAAGKIIMQVISAVAEFEKDLLIERTYSGLASARTAGKRVGRPPALNQEQRQAALGLLRAGASISAIAREFSTSRQTIMRLRDDAVSPELLE
ncbi:resolvase [Pantoea coffeiphila]|uniref:Resolvase n=1 Tax=Pantoea coffeiphila TaxID=1465635 RepID=A0A2S9I724_9GAMM|nr:resolvase [Pantoea coffeiphila]